MYLEKFSLKDRIAVVTGAGRGIGLEIARALAEAGAAVIIAEIIEENGRAAARSLAEAGYRAEFQPLDVADSGAISRFADAIVAKYGRIHILVNNAGMANSFKTVDYPDEEYRRLMRVNLDGARFWAAHACGRRRQRGQRGLHVGPDRQQAAAPGGIQRQQRGYTYADQVLGLRMGKIRCARQCRGARLHQHRTRAGWPRDA